MTRLAELGRIVAGQQDRSRAGKPRDERAAERFVLELRRSKRVSGTLWGRAVLVAAAAAVVLGVVSWRRHAAVSAQGAPPAVEQPLFARDGETVPLNFPDGSRVVLASGTEAVVHELHDTGAKLEVSRGEASVAVRHQASTNWTVGAGPYRVHVTGTRFSVGWAPEPARFELHLMQGSVVVTTETGSHAAVTMVAPATLVIDPNGWQLSGPSAPPVEAAKAVEGAAAPEAGEAPISDDEVHSSAVDSQAVPAPQAPAAPGWEALARKGEYSAAYDDAARRGIGQLADSRPSSALLSLAEACRFSKHTSDATQVLTRLRARFPGSDDAATAAFQLGRLSGTPNWFRTYLQERPDGALVQEASGRLLEALSRSGDSAGAKLAAATYLARYPNGSHAAFARQLLGR